MRILRTAGAALLATGCLATAHAGLNAWSGNGPSGGRTTRVIIDPSDPDRMYLLGYGVGLHTSDDAGASWQKTNPDLTQIQPAQISDIAIDPNAPATLFLVDSGPEVARSSDGGQTWELFDAGLAGAGLFYVYASPAAAGVVFATDSGDLYRSQDNGENWILIDGGLGLTVVEQVVFDPTDPTVLYAVGWEGIYKSTDGGDSWDLLDNGLPAPNAQGYVFARTAIVDPQNPQTVYLQISNEGVFKSTNGGAAWAPASLGLPNDFFTGFAIDPVDSDRIYLGTGNNDVIVTTDGGASWQNLPNAGLGDTTVDDLAIDPTDPSRLYAATFMRGLYLSEDAGGSWTGSSEGFVNTTALSVAYDSGTGRAYAGVSGGAATSVDGGQSWTLNGGDYDLATYAIAPDPLLADHVYAGSSCCGLYESFDDGATYARIDLGLPGVVATWVTDIDIPEGDPAVLLFSDYNRGLFGTRDGGATWERLTAGLEPFFSGNVVLAAVDAVADQPLIIYAASAFFNGGGVYKSIDGGTTWEKKSGAGAPTRAAAVAAHPSDPDIVLAGGFSGLRRSTDGGDTWGSAPVLSGDITDVYVDYADPQLAYAVARNATLYRSVDGGVTWQPTAEMPGGRPVELAVDGNEPGRVLVGFEDIGVQEYAFATDLVLAQTVSAAALLPGETATIDVTVDNAGPLDATAVSLSQTLPPSLAWVSAGASQGACTVDGEVLSCALGTLANGAGASATLTVEAVAAGSADSVLDAAAREAEIEPADNSATLSLTVGGSDTDGDGVLDGADNCTEAINADQRDTDGDGIGNLCDTDLDQNCVVNFADLALLKDAFFGSDPDADFDGGGSVNFGDLALLKDAFFGTPGPSGIANLCNGG